MRILRHHGIGFAHGFGPGRHGVHGGRGHPRDAFTAGGRNRHRGYPRAHRGLPHSRGAHSPLFNPAVSPLPNILYPPAFGSLSPGGYGGTPASRFPIDPTDPVAANITPENGVDSDSAEAVDLDNEMRNLALPPASSFFDPKQFGDALARQIAGNGFSGVNIGGAADELSAPSNPYSNPVNVAAHEMGPFGSQGQYTRNLARNSDSTIRGRLAESKDTVHDDPLKVDAAAVERLKQIIRHGSKRALKQMERALKIRASEAAAKDAAASKAQMRQLQRESNGDIGKINPNTGHTYGSDIKRKKREISHETFHALNPDLYKLEAKAKSLGLPAPTTGQDVYTQADIEAEELIDARRRRRQALEERKTAEDQAIAQNKAELNEQLQQIETAEAQSAEQISAQQRELLEAQAANHLYQEAAAGARDQNIAQAEAAAAGIATAAAVKDQQAALQEAIASSASPLEQALVAGAANGSAAAAAAAAGAAKAANTIAALEEGARQAQIARDEATVAALGEQANKNQEVANLNQAIANLNATRENLERQAAAEDLASQNNANEIKAALSADPDALSKIGEAAIENGSILRGRDLANAAAGAAAIAEAARQRGNMLAEAKEQQNAIGEQARALGDALREKQLQEAAVQQQAAADAAKLAHESAKEQSVAAASETARKQIDAEVEKSIAEDAANQAGFEKDDPYKILGTIPDDADTVAIKNSSISFPLKTFGTTKAHNQAEAGALAAQNKIKDDIRGKVTAEKFDTPLNVIKGEAGYLNVPENAQKINVDNGRIYMTESGIQQMNKDGIDTSMFEQKINTGERSDMGIGLKYFVADSSGMTMDIPSPSNPDPPRIMSGKGKTIDISRAEGLDIEKGELKLEKWNDYSRRIRPQVNVSIQSNGHEAIIDALVDDDCVKQALKDADILYNTISELHINPSGEKYITLRPPYGVTETLNFDEAISNLNRIQQSCRITHGQSGINVMQESDLKSSTEHKRSKHKQINVAENSEDVCISASEEERIRVSALTQASNQRETHKIISHENAFDKKEHDSKSQIIDSGAKTIETETGLDRETVINEVGTTREEVEEAKEKLLEENEMKLDTNEETTKHVTEEIRKEEEAIKDAGEIKIMMQKESSNIAKEMGMSEEEFTSLLSTTNINIFKSLIQYSRNPRSTFFKEMAERSKNQLRLVFGTHSETFSKLIFANISKKFKISDPDEHVLIKKETTLVPMIVNTTTSQNKFGGHTTVFKQGLVPRTIITRIPIVKRTIIRRRRGTTNSRLPIGPIISGALDERKGDPNAIKQISTIPSRNDMIGPGGLGVLGNKLKVGDSATLIGLNSEIDKIVDPESIGYITKPEVANKTEVRDTGIQEKGTAFPSSGRVLSERKRALTSEECKNLTEDVCKQLRK